MADGRLRSTRRLDQIAGAHLVGVRRRRCSSAAAAGSGRTAQRTSWPASAACASSSTSARTGVQQAIGSSTAVFGAAMCDTVSKIVEESIDNRRCSRYASPHRQTSMYCWRRCSGGITMSRVQLALNVADLDASIEFYTKLFQTPAGQDPRRLRQLRDRRSAAEAGAVHRHGRARHAEPHRRRGRDDRRGRSGDRPHQDSGSTRRSRRTCRVASRCRTRPGSRVPRTTGSSTPCSATHRDVVRHRRRVHSLGRQTVR